MSTSNDEIIEWTPLVYPIKISDVSELQRAVIRAEIAMPFRKEQKKRKVKLKDRESLIYR